jgi:formate/nitrite transporter FocA (FNT family)
VKSLVGTTSAPSAREAEPVDEALRETFGRTIDEGRRRLGRTWPALFATGVVGGLDVGAGVFGFLVVKEQTHNELLAALAFTIGFVALTLAHSELFTEDFLVPVATVVAGQARIRDLLRLWGGTAATNLLGGWIITGLTLAALPHLRAAAIESGVHYTSMGIGWEAFASGILGGGAITLMTWMQHSSDSVGGKIVAAISVAFLLAAGPLNHAIVASLLMFAAIHAHGPFDYLDWAGAASWAALANIVGGLGLVTVLRLVQIGREAVEEERRRPAGAPRGEEARGGTDDGARREAAELADDPSLRDR